jgi:homoserine O-acetyltransferase
MKIFQSQIPLQLEGGDILPSFQIAYQTWGTLNAAKNNVVWICHALTGNADAAAWWPGIIGKDALFDPDKHFIICANVIGSCYGSTYALSPNPETGTPYYYDFPFITIRDMIHGFIQLREALEISQIKLLVGGSLGGQQVLEWAILEPEVFEYCVPIATNAFHSPWGIAFNEAQRMSIQADGSWGNKVNEAGIMGLKAARATALISYRNYAAYHITQEQQNIDVFDGFKASSYQQYQGEKLAKRFDAFAYWTLSKAMDSHQVGRGRGGIEKALGRIKAKTLVLGIDSDVLFPVSEQQLIANHIENGDFQLIRSMYGHDGFLIEVGQINSSIQNFIKTKAENPFIQ